LPARPVPIRVAAPAARFARSCTLLPRIRCRYRQGRGSQAPRPGGRGAAIMMSGGCSYPAALNARRLSAPHGGADPQRPFADQSPKLILPVTGSCRHQQYLDFIVNGLAQALLYSQLRTTSPCSPCAPRADFCLAALFWPSGRSLTPTPKRDPASLTVVALGTAATGVVIRERGTHSEDRWRRPSTPVVRGRPFPGLPAGETRRERACAHQDRGDAPSPTRSFLCRPCRTACWRGPLW
jgi:hypothetical protein